MNLVSPARSAHQDEAETLRLYESFVYREARLMDNHQYDEWFKLWTEDALYWLPCNEEDLDIHKSVSLIYENLEKIEERILRLKGKFAHAQSPKSRLMRIVSNIEIESVSDSEIIGTSCFVLGDVRLDRQNVWFGRNHHTLIRTEDGLKMRKKKVFILNNDSPMANLTFLV
ncbi:aromatic-ring-hydroxylating dioxygenase subunit beta [Aquibium sp. LZ166]|uniref:Aromatic-ring-hydroxylating dioxygenase subunit beta n=1 Tax=Aquibium pacificus TaxID=3153579 RepID=A0ABV3SF06_9HYPH